MFRLQRTGYSTVVETGEIRKQYRGAFPTRRIHIVYAASRLKDEFVEKILSEATEMADIDLVMMDRGFDSESVKDTCEEYGVHYLNPTRIFERGDEAETIAWMYRNSKRFHVAEDESDGDTPTRKQIYLPKRSNSDNDNEDGSLSEVWKEMCGDWEFDDV